MENPESRQAAVRQGRARVKAALGDLDAALASELGFVPRGRWLLPLIGTAVGLALGFAVRLALGRRKTRGAVPSGRGPASPGDD